MKWRDATKECPEFGRKIWVWDNENHYPFLLTFRGAKQTWEYNKYNPRFPLWAYAFETEKREFMAVTDEQKQEINHLYYLVKTEIENFDDPLIVVSALLRILVDISKESNDQFGELKNMYTAMIQIAEMEA